MNYGQITNWYHEIIRTQAVKGGFYIDATMGRGNDTLLLCKLAREEGRVLAFDIQPEALHATRALLKEHKLESRAELILAGHEQMDVYAKPDTADVICFNFGYLPGGDHHIATKAETSVAALQKSLKLLKSGGMISLCIYSGGDTGFEEKDKLLAYLKTLPSCTNTVILNTYYNREKNPPIPAFIFKR